MAKSKWYKIEPFLPKIKQWIRKGVYEYQIIERLKISKPTWEKYKKTNPELATIIREAKLLRHDDLIPDLENALLKVALGYTESEAEVREEHSKDDEGNVTIKKVVVTKTYGPDAKAASILLQNLTRDKDKKFSNNPAELDIKKEKLELEKKAAKMKEEGWD